MPLSMSHFFMPPVWSDYEQSQKAKLLHTMLLVSFGGALLAAVLIARYGWWTDINLLLVFAAVSLCGFILNQRLHLYAAAMILCVSLFLIIIAITLVGEGIYDEAILAYPVFLFAAAFLFGQRGLLAATALSVFGVAAFFPLQVFRLYESSDIVTPTRIILLGLILLVTALVVRVVRQTWELHLRHLEASYDLTLEGWAKALEYRDTETAGHTRRVTELTVALARQMSCSENQIVAIRRGAYLHDIGKMAIPDNILLKPGPLDPAEREIIETHPTLALQFISDIPFLHSASIIPYCHHEHWDGSGYPKGLKGEAIPLAARIFTVVDHWDALSSDRPYRKAWTKELVLAYLEANAGKLYDPRVVASFLTLVR